MDSNDVVDERKWPPLDPVEYHRRLVTAILDTGVEHASPLQIYERMTLPNDPNNLSFRDLQLGQIKSHLQRFRMVYKSIDPRNSPRKKFQLESNTKNAEKQDFLDDYDSFVDFGLDAAAARSDENHASVLGGRVIGLVSRMVMMNDGVPIQEFSKVPSMQEKDDVGNRATTIERRNLDTTIPKLTPSEAAAPLGKSLKLVVGMLEHLNNYITSERQGQQPKEATPQLDQGSDLPNEATTIGKVLPNKKSEQSALPDTLERISLLPPLTRGGQHLQLPISPHLLTQQPLVHPSIAGQVLRQQQQQQKRQQVPPNPPESLPSSQPQGRARINSLSDVSSIGENALMTDENLHFALEEVLEEVEEKTAKTQRLGKFIPVKGTDNDNIKIQGRIYRPPMDQIQQGYWQHDPNQNPPSDVPPRIGSFDISPATQPKSTVEVQSHALAALAATAVLESQNQSIVEPPTLQQHGISNPLASTTTSGLPRHSTRESMQAGYDKPNHRKDIPATSRRSPVPKLLKYKATKWRQRYKHPTKKKMFQKLQKAIVGLRKVRSKESLPSHKGGDPPILQRDPNKANEKNRSATGKTTLEEDASVVSSLSSSSSSSLESESFSLTARGVTVATTRTTPSGMLIEEAVGGGLVVSPTNTVAKTNRTEEEEEEDWIFDHFPIPRHLRLEICPKGHSSKQPQQVTTDRERKDESGNYGGSPSSSTDLSWGIVEVEDRRA